eukprot:1158293-Pelagomonas_calceolata.AAC.8
MNANKWTRHRLLIHTISKFPIRQGEASVALRMSRISLQKHDHTHHNCPALGLATAKTGACSRFFITQIKHALTDVPSWPWCCHNCAQNNTASGNSKAMDMQCAQLRDDENHLVYRGPCTCSRPGKAKNVCSLAAAMSGVHLQLRWAECSSSCG